MYRYQYKARKSAAPRGVRSSFRAALMEHYERQEALQALNSGAAGEFSTRVDVLDRGLGLVRISPVEC